MMKITIKAVACMLLLLSGCAGVEEKLAEQSSQIHLYHKELTVDPMSLPERSLDWETAVSMLKSNLVMRNAREEIVRSEVAVKRVYLDLIPQLTIQGLYQQAISQFTELSSDNLNVNVNAMFMIPGLLQLRMKHYAAMLVNYKAQRQYEMAFREEVVNLYGLFRQYRRLQEARAIDTLKNARPHFSVADQQELEFRYNQEEKELWLALSAATGAYSHRWVVVDDSLPEFDYHSRIPQWDDPSSIGTLFTTLQAIELEGARLRELGVKFQYWPQLNMRVYSPSVYLMSGGDRGGFEFNADDVRYEASVRMRLDTNLQVRDQLRELRRNTKLLKQKLYQDGHERTKKLMAAYDSLAIMKTNHRQLAARKRLLEISTPPRTYEAFEKMRSERIELMIERLNLEKERDTVISLLWVADESKWTDKASGERSEI